jgi:hypothetical protein
MVMPLLLIPLITEYQLKPWSEQEAINLGIYMADGSLALFAVLEDVSLPRA